MLITRRSRLMERASRDCIAPCLSGVLSFFAGFKHGRHKVDRLM
ncbi:hypothetical protein [Paenibacillus lactis]|nr:hypothetical protein [Paenibacillus lactis]